MLYLKIRGKGWDPVAVVLREMNSRVRVPMILDSCHREHWTPSSSQIRSRRFSISLTIWPYGRAVALIWLTLLRSSSTSCLKRSWTKKITTNADEAARRQDGGVWLDIGRRQCRCDMSETQHCTMPARSHRRDKATGSAVCVSIFIVVE